MARLEELEEDKDIPMVGSAVRNKIAQFVNRYSYPYNKEAFGTDLEEVVEAVRKDALGL